MRPFLNPTFVLVLATLVFANHQGSGVVISFLTRSPITLHEPIAIDCTVKNAGDQVILVDFGCLRGCRGTDATALRLDITDPSGKRTEMPPLEGPRSPKAIERNSNYRKRFILNEWHDFADPGQYQVKIWIGRDVTTVSGESSMSKEIRRSL